MNKNTPGVKTALHTLKRGGDSGLLDEWSLVYSNAFREAVEAEIHRLVNATIENQFADENFGPWAVLAGACEPSTPGNIHFFMNLDGDTRPVFKTSILDLVEYEIEGYETSPGKTNQDGFDCLNVLADALDVAAKRCKNTLELEAE